MTDQGSWPHERLTVYGLSIDYAVECTRLAESLPRGHREFRSQLTRAAYSVSRNIAEGASRISHADKRSRFNVARGEVAECDAILDLIGRLELVPKEVVRQRRSEGSRISAMLLGLVRRHEDRARGGEREQLGP